MTLEPPHFKISRSELPQLLFRMENKHRPGGNPYTEENPIRKSYRFLFLLLSPYRNSLWSHLQALLCTVLSRVRFFATPRTAACQAPLSLGFSRQQYWSGLLFPTPRDLPDPGIKPASPALQGQSLPLSHLGSLFLYVSMLYDLNVG